MKIPFFSNTCIFDFAMMFCKHFSRNDELKQMIKKSRLLFIAFLLVAACNQETEAPIYTLATQVIPANGGSVSPEAGEYEENATVDLYATPNDEYVFSGWSGSLSETTNPVTLEMTSDKTITAEFVKKQYELAVTIAGEGTVEESISDLDGAYESGTVVELIAKPAEGWQFKEWTGEASGSDNPLVLTINEAKAINATFIKKTYSLEVTIEGNGTMTEAVVEGVKVGDVYEHGTVLNLEAVPATGWEFVEWTGDISATTISVEITMDTLKQIGLLFRKSKFEYTVSTVLTGYDIIWGFDFLEENSLIFTEKTGNIYVHRNDKTEKLGGFPTAEVNSAGQGGLLDIAVPPDYQETGWVYTVFSKKSSTSTVGGHLTLIRFKINGTTITDIENIFEITETSTRNGHYGSRIAFTQNHLFLSVGEGSPSLGGADSPYQNAQNIDTYWGKIHRIHYDGSIPTDNPVFEGQSAPNSIYSIGHRNPQGLTINPMDGSVWSSEHGPKGGDEINVILPGKNYGWPLVSYGVNYNNSDISGKSHSGYEEPLYFWDPSIATSNIDFIENKSSAWFGNLLVAGLKTKSIFRLEYTQGSLNQVERIELGSRVRNVKEKGDGSIYISLESPGSIIALVPNFD